MPIIRPAIISVWLIIFLSGATPLYTIMIAAGIVSMPWWLSIRRRSYLDVLAVLFVIMLIGAYLLVKGFQKQEFGYFIYSIRMIVDVLIGSLFTCSIFKIIGIKKDDLMNGLILFVILQLVFSVYISFNLDNKSHILMTVLDYGADHKLVADPFLIGRGFGFSKSLLFTFPLMIGLIAVFFSMMADRKLGNFFLKTFMWLACLILILVNARIGMVPILLFIVLCLAGLFSSAMLKLRVSLIGSVVLFVVLVTCFFMIFLLIGNEEFVRDMQGESIIFNSLARLISLLSLIYEQQELVEQTNFYDNQLALAGLNNKLIGDGIVLRGFDQGYSDIGYIRMFYFGGFVLLVLVFLLQYIVGWFAVSGLYAVCNQGYGRTGSSLFLWLFTSGVLLVGGAKGEIFLVNEVTKLLIFFGFFGRIYDEKFHASSNR